ncbi:MULTISPECIES: hypothetical protein [unclassified Moorena]|uniref:hypothetical protein n=1 Tax=unclassified Moorena TaxID=2683338 RepID=UPI0013BBF175|nr:MULTISPECIES: hypothetical protein [unclassified Moorena]NEP34441.1 hypothetical protein [Moorena sp. SIO3B2]NEQ09861.1 hypothetical protein [Moorena sp. SIO4E2]
MLINIKIERRSRSVTKGQSMKKAMPTNTRRVGIAQVNSGRIWGWFEAIPTLQNAIALLLTGCISYL